MNTADEMVDSGPGEPTVEEMLADANTDTDAADGDTGGSLIAALAAIRRGAEDADVSVTVDLHGRLVGLTLGRRAMRLRATELAAVICRLTVEAAAAALTDGLAVLAASGTCHPAVLAELAAGAGVRSSA
jgi:hypothetical protein